MTGTGIAASLTTLVTLGIAQPIRFGLQKRVQRLLHRATDHTVQVTFDPLVINRDDIAQRTRCILCHGGSLSLSWLRLATSSSSQIRGRQPYSIVRKIHYVILPCHSRLLASTPVFGHPHHEKIRSDLRSGTVLGIEALLRNPITGIAGRCARATSGQTT